MAKITLKTLSSGFLSIAQMNENFQDIASEFQNKVLYRDNPAGEPNTMLNNLDMNSKRVLNLPSPISGSEAARLTDVRDALAVTLVSIPSFVDNEQKALSTDGIALVFKETALTVDTYAELTALLKAALPNGTFRQVLGRTTRGDIEPVLFEFVSASALTANGGTVLATDEGGVGRWLLRFRGALNVLWFGVPVTAITAQAALDAVAVLGGTVKFPTTDTYTFIDSLVISTANTTIDLQDGPLLDWTTLGTATVGSFGAGTTAIDVQTNNFKILGGKLKGPEVGIFVLNSCLILMVGTDTTTRLSGLHVEDVEMQDSGAYGIFGQYVNDIQVLSNFVHNVGLSGMSFLSCDNGLAFNNLYETIGPGSIGNMWGISLTHFSLDYDINPGAGTKQATEPFCVNWAVIKNEAEDLNWTGIDAHGCYNSIWAFNKTYNCLIGMQVSSSSGDAINFAGDTNIVCFNILDARNRDGTVSGRENIMHGLNLNGGSTVFHTNLNAFGNTTIGYGTTDNVNSGAIQAEECDGYLNGSQIYDWGGNGIKLGNAQTFTVDNSLFGAVATATETAGRCIVHDGIGGADLDITNNKHRAGGGFTANTGFRGTLLTKRVNLNGNDFSEATLDYMLSANGFVTGTDLPIIINAVSLDTTPDISAARGINCEVRLPNASATAVTNFIGGKEGQRITVVNNGAGATTLTRGATLATAGAAPIVLTAAKKDSAVMTLVGVKWTEVSKSINVS